jgi:hypothetical protein|tara:strand:- start:425 stop:781 length:357 start_codon:yes stop_codon:yes gene_type:complete
MRKLFLVFFLCSLSSSALAKVEIWMCNSMYGIDVYKLDTNQPSNTSQRINKNWKKFWTPGQESEVKNIMYDPIHKNIRIIYSIEQDKKEMLFDLVARDLIIKFQDQNKSNSKWSCELK